MIWNVRYIYEGSVWLETFPEASGLLHVTKKYLLPDKLQEECRGRVWATIYPHSVWEALEFAQQNNEVELAHTAWQVRGIQFQNF